ncbi:MAG TPA: CaiB/BaiF CoA-transferase family protein [Arthrobacter sp.]|jgi:crotonobetainyl-CoA:carnitine CoA-transferase CaiB-like acyl-CoA transferase
MREAPQPHIAPGNTSLSPKVLPLAGIRVLDLSRALAGPYATALLADLGAEVIKVESIKGGDSSRAWAPFENDHSLYFDSTNRGKSSIAVDFYAEAGRDLLWRLALRCDVVVENFRPGVLSTMGLDPDLLRAAKPELIIASVSGFGATGPLSQAAGLDQVAQGMSGLMSVTGADAENMFRVGVPIIDMVSGIVTALGVAAALAGRERNGSGMEVSTSLLETALSLSSFQGQRFLSTGDVPVPQGNNHPTLSPYGAFNTADLPLIIAVGNEKQWVQLCELLNEPELADDPDYRTGRLRTLNRQELKRRIEQLLLADTAEHWMERLRAAKIPAGPIYNYEQAFADKQVQALGMVQTVHRSDGTVLPLLRGPISIDRQAPHIRKAPPALGEDTRSVLAELNLTDDQIIGLVEAGIVLTADATQGVA